MRRARALIAVTMVAAGVWWCALPAGAQAPAHQGWWTVLNPGLGPAGPPASPDVPADGLVVQGAGAAPPSAYSALVFDLAGGEAIGTLTLKVAPGSGSTPGAQLIACPLLTATFTPAQGGSMGDAPPYDCTRQVAGRATAASDSYTFDVARLASGGGLALAIIPGATTARVVFSHPGPDALAASLPAVPSAGSAPQSSAPQASAPQSSPPPAPTPTPVDPPSLAAVPTVTSSGDGVVAPPSAATTPTAVGSDQAAAGPTSSGLAASVPSVAAAARSRWGSRLLVALFIALAGTAAGLWRFAGRSAATDVS